MSINIDNLYNKFLNEMNSNPELNDILNTHLQKLFYDIKLNALRDFKCSYCLEFKISKADIHNIFNDFPNITDIEISEAFNKDWNLLYNNIHIFNYYYKLLLIIYHAIKTSNDKLAYNTISLILFRIWNVQLTNFIKYCDVNIMKVAVSKTKNEMIKKYDSPLYLIEKHLTKIIFKKNISYILENSSKTKRLFYQCHQMIKSLFRFDVNQNSSEPKHNIGLQIDYYETYLN